MREDLEVNRQYFNNLRDVSEWKPGDPADWMIRVTDPADDRGWAMLRRILRLDYGGGYTLARGTGILESMNKLYKDAESALAGLLSDGLLLAIGGIGLCGIPEALIASLCQSGVRDLTIATIIA